MSCRREPEKMKEEGLHTVINNLLDVNQLSMNTHTPSRLKRKGRDSVSRSRKANGSSSSPAAPGQHPAPVYTTRLYRNPVSELQMLNILMPCLMGLAGMYWTNLEHLPL